jgi:chromosome segregation ATPase
VESYWRDELKKMSASVSVKKEVIAAGALLPQVSPDTVRILVKAEQRKNSPLLTAHVAILTTAGYVGPTTNERAYEAARAFVQQHSTALRRQLAQQEITTAEKGLTQLRTELSNLQRERERAKSSIEKSRQRAAEAVTDQQKARATMDQLTPRIEAKRVEVAQTPSDAGTKELNDLLKQQTKAQDTERKALETERNMVKKGEELELQVKKYDEEELRKQEAIARQETLVGTLREKLDAIR